ncbi:MAG: imidazole glycerol phosphate synthase subunit HisH [Bacteroidaceae bacterium]|nr:imidazole glycerol phosphate synthase subunit HisH [Bacteroidaceae bacterium]
MKVAVVKYNAGNIFSVVHALERMGVEPILTDSAEELRSADRVIFPGQGEASGAMHYLRQHGLDSIIRSLTQPVLGICIGQQLMCRHSEEGDVDCLGIFDADVKRFRPLRHEDKIPHMGWNSIQNHKILHFAQAQAEALARRSQHNSKLTLFEGLDGEFVYFVHSYYVPVCEHTTAVTEYIHPFSAAMQKDNFYATQFHPEKSGAVGQQILRNFLEL